MKLNRFTIFVNEDLTLNQSVEKIIADEEKSFKERLNYLEQEKNNLLQQSKQVQMSIGLTKNLDDQRLLKNKLINLKKQLENLTKQKEKVETDKEKKIIELKKVQQNVNQAEEKLKAIEPVSQEDSIAENNKNSEFIIKRKFANMREIENPNQALKPIQQKPIQTIQKPKTLIVNFDKSTDTPFQVKFTERGFLIGNTRLSFENLADALSKEYNIVLDNGTGLVLDAVRMQKILKYKDRTE